MKYASKIWLFAFLCFALPAASQPAPASPLNTAGLELRPNGTWTLARMDDTTQDNQPHLLELKPNGAFSFDRINAFVGYFDSKGRRPDQLRAKPADGYPLRDGAAWETRVTLSPKNAAEPITLKQRVERLDETAFRLRYEATQQSGQPSRERFLQLEIPLAIASGRSARLDGVEHVFPTEFKNVRLFSANEACPRTLVLPSATGTVTIEGAFSVLAQDQRKWKRDSYSLRLRFSSGTDTTVPATFEAIFRFSTSPNDIQPQIVTAGPEWVEHVHEREIKAGSVFDFSLQLDAPAGKHGPVFATKEGHFAFRDRPAKRIRFWGVNLCYGSNFPDEETADRLADSLARSGYNSVRLHHYDRELQKPGGASWELDPEKLDRFDYLFAALKKRGLYINIDLYSSRTFSPDEFAAVGFDPALASEGTAHWRFKSILPVSDKAFEMWSKFARNLLTHRNPYTGLTWGEDPALAGICPVNEDPPRGRVDSDPVVSRLYREQYDKWIREPSIHLIPAYENETAERAFNRFIYDRQIRYNDRLRDFLRNLGVQTPLTGTNAHVNQWLAFVRERYDYVDMHPYWDHPSFPGERFSLPLQFKQASATKTGAHVPRVVMPVRILSKPFAVTEFNFVRPNRYRAEGGVLMPAYASLQDWDALYNFDYGPVSLTPSIGGMFSVGSDPIGQIADRVGAAIFLRGDISPAHNEIAFAVQPSTAFASREKPFPETFARLGLVTRIGSLPVSANALLRERNVSAVVEESADHRSDADRRIYAADKTLAENLQRDGVLPPGSISGGGTQYVSETGQIELRTEPGTLKVVTPRSELFVLPADASLAGDRVAVRNGSAFGTVVVMAVDGKTISDSSRLLVTHLTDSLPTGARFTDPHRRLLEDRGSLPHLVHRGSADLTLRLADRGHWKAWAVSSSGLRLREVTVVKNGNEWLLKTETVTESGTQLAYELLRE